MNQKNHTPGPWEISENGKLPITLFARDGRWRGNYTEIAAIGNSVWGTGDFSETLANARLIAAAPDLLAALKEITALVELGDDGKYGHEAVSYKGVLNEARTAIAKAEGK